MRWTLGLAITPLRALNHTETGHFLSSRAAPNFHIGPRLAVHDAVIRVYDAAGNVIETHEHKGEFKEP